MYPRARCISQCHKHGPTQRYLAAGLPAALRQDPVKPELAKHPQCRRHMTMRQAAQQRQRLLIRRHHRLVAQHAAQWAATAEPRQGPVFIAGDRAVTEDQVRSKLQDNGWSNIQIARDGDYFGVSGVKNGQPGKLAIDSRTGRLRANDDDDDD
jgi:hypothetical protein